jgi:hydrogenase 3 maturation protease
MLSERRFLNRRVAVMGIGNEYRGDDAAGVLVARSLARIAGDHLLVVEAGLAPENQTAALRRFQPDLVLIVDAAELGEDPGSVRWLSWQETDGLTASTHTTPPSLLGRFLAESLACEVVLIGIQPDDTSFGAPLSVEVAAAVNAISESIKALLGDRALIPDYVGEETR